MFFIGIFGTSQKVVPAGELPALKCPVCGHNVRMHLCRKYDYFHAFFLPLVKYGNLYFATCPSCSSVFGLENQLAQRVERGEDVPVTQADLRLLRDNHILRCPSCGAPQVPGSVFCSQCGAKL